MSKLDNLVEVTDEEKKAVFEHYNLTEEKFEESVDILKEWLRQSEHLPKDDHDNKIRLLLLNSKMSLEKAKTSVEGYYRVRSRYYQDFFDKLIPSTKEYTESKNYCQTVVMPKLTSDLCRITIFKLDDPDGIASDALQYHFPAFMIAEIRITKDICLSNIIVVDFEAYSWKNFMKYTPTVNQMLVDMLNSINLRIKSVHFININPILDQVMRVIKVILPEKIVGKIKIHKTYESLLAEIPGEYLPSNYGGSQKSVEELYDEWCNMIEQSTELFEKLLPLKSSAKLELDREQQEMFGCGVEGSFRRLALD